MTQTVTALVMVGGACRKLLASALLSHLEAGIQRYAQVLSHRSIDAPGF
jgi:hypothetical protein